MSWPRIPRNYIPPTKVTWPDTRPVLTDEEVAAKTARVSFITREIARLTSERSQLSHELAIEEGRRAGEPPFPPSGPRSPDRTPNDYR